jgi:hypothetical protein
MLGIEGKIMANERRTATLGVWLDRLLIGAIGMIFIYFGNKIDELTKKVGALAENMASVATEIKYTNQKTDTLNVRFEQHLEEERARILAGRR